MCVRKVESSVRRWDLDDGKEGWRFRTIKSYCGDEKNVPLLTVAIDEIYTFWCMPWDGAVALTTLTVDSGRVASGRLQQGKWEPQRFKES